MSTDGQGAPPPPPPPPPPRPPSAPAQPQQVHGRSLGESAGLLIAGGVLVIIAVVGYIVIGSFEPTPANIITGRSVMSESAFQLYSIALLIIGATGAILALVGLAQRRS